MTLPLLLGPFLLTLAADADPRACCRQDRSPDDVRLTHVRTLNDKDFFLKVPPSREHGSTAPGRPRTGARRHRPVAAARETPLNAVIHGKIDRDEITVEKVFFASLPGHYVSGNLYRPKAAGDVSPPVVRSPASSARTPLERWPLLRCQGRRGQGKSPAAARKTEAGAHYPLQARCAQLAQHGLRRLSLRHGGLCR